MNLTVYWYPIIGLIVSYFRRKGATSEETAITMTDLDWMEMGFLSSPPKTAFLWDFKKFLRQTKDGRYWLDTQKAQEYRQNQTNMITVMLIATVIFIVVGFIVSALSAL
ncbi:MAG: hypothetical protein ACD_22C00237G0006 [uncultured bacterium]|nr:MAG: hypothetical protein ACD_22C00237G0006 [uncultured bacterium]